MGGVPSPAHACPRGQIPVCPHRRRSLVEKRSTLAACVAPTVARVAPAWWWVGLWFVPLPTSCPAAPAAPRCLISRPSWRPWPLRSPPTHARAPPRPSVSALLSLGAFLFTTGCNANFLVWHGVPALFFFVCTAALYLPAVLRQSSSLRQGVTPPSTSTSFYNLLAAAVFQGTLSSLRYFATL